jgi:hypothetical protein
LRRGYRLTRRLRPRSKRGIGRAELDLSFDYSQFGTYYEGKNDLPTALEYQRKTLAIRRDLAASDPKDVWKQDRFAYALTSTAHLQLVTRDSRGALANLEESRKISERLGISDKRRMEDYGYTLSQAGYANRYLGDEQTACEQFSKARDLYRRLGYSPSGTGGSRLAEMEKDLATCTR